MTATAYVTDLPRGTYVRWVGEVWRVDRVSPAGAILHSTKAESKSAIASGFASAAVTHASRRRPAAAPAS
jgi:hypothetical protein